MPTTMSSSTRRRVENESDNAADATPAAPLKEDADHSVDSDEPALEPTRASQLSTRTCVCDTMMLFVVSCSPSQCEL